MMTKRQEALVNSFLLLLDDDFKPLYQDLISCLYEFGYNPHKQRSYILFKHDLHGKQMAKAGIKKRERTPYFELRFSACRGYSQKFENIVREAALKYPDNHRNCVTGDCDYCAGEPETHIYTYTLPDGSKKYHCGSYVLEIPDITADDIDEIKKLIKEEHVYLMKHQVGMDVE